MLFKWLSNGRNSLCQSCVPGAGGRAGGRARAALCPCRRSRGGASAPGALLLRELQDEENKQGPRSAAQHRFGLYYNASREIPIACAVYTCISLQAHPHHKLREVNWLPVLPILSLSRKTQKESYVSSLLLKYLKILPSISLWELWVVENKIRNIHYSLWMWKKL